MREPRREWTDDEIAKLRSLAGKMSIEEIAAELGRSPGATAVKACNLGLSLRRPRNAQRGDNASVSPTPESSAQSSN
jgi:hypothetical protein